MNQCDVCLVEWDPRVQIHRRGQDCVQRLHEEVMFLESRLKELHLLGQEAVKEATTRTDLLGGAIEQIGKGLETLAERFDGLARRVTMIEHPGMKKAYKVKE